MTASFGPVFLCVLNGVCAAHDKPAAVSIQAGNTTVEFRIGSDLVGRYHIDPAAAKPFFWPVNAPGGIPVTRAWPMQKGQPGESADHIHQKSVWFCHGDVIPEGMPLKHKIKNVDGVDFWSEVKGHGRIVCTKVAEPNLAQGRGFVVTQNEWRTADDTKILDAVELARRHQAQVAGRAGRALEAGIVDHVRHAVGRQLHVELGVREPLPPGGLEGGQRVLRKVFRVAPVCDDFRCVRTGGSWLQ